MDIDLKIYGIEINFDLFVDLLELSDIFFLIKIDGYGRVKLIFDFDLEFVDWLLDKDWYEICLFVYDEESFIIEFDLDE